MLRLFALAGLAMTVLALAWLAAGAGAERHALHRHLCRGRAGAGQGRRRGAARLSRRRAQGRRQPRCAPAHRPAQPVRRARRLGRPEGVRRACGRRAAKKLNEKLATHAGLADRHPPAQRPVGRAGQGRQGRRSSPSPTSMSFRRRRTTAPTRSSSSPTAAAGTPAICSSTSGGRPTGPTISPWWKPGPTAAPSTSIRCRRKPASSA